MISVNTSLSPSTTTKGDGGMWSSKSGESQKTTHDGALSLQLSPDGNSLEKPMPVQGLDSGGSKGADAS